MATAAPEIPSLARDRAFEALYRRYVEDVYHYALALLRNPADAEDVTQTTFMNAYRAFDRGEQIEKPQNWLIKITHNVARSRYARAARRVKEVPLEDHLEQLALPEDERPDIEAVLEALGRLPLNQRAALVMRELEGRTYAEIADTLGVSVPAVETLIFRGRRSLRLRSSAIRVLSVVPVPGSLSQLFDAGGTAVVGGGAIMGGGFLLKAAVAIIAGVVATGVGGDHSPRAAAAADAASRAVDGIWAVGAELQLPVDRPVAPSLLASVRTGARAVVRAEHVRGGVVTSRRATLPREDSTGWAAPSQTSSSSGQTSSATTPPAPAAESGPVSTVQSAVDTVSAALPTPSVPSAPLPQLPVATPTLPPPPTLPLPGLP